MFHQVSEYHLNQKRPLHHAEGDKIPLYHLSSPDNISDLWNAITSIRPYFPSRKIRSGNPLRNVFQKVLFHALHHPAFLCKQKIFLLLSITAFGT